MKILYNSLTKSLLLLTLTVSPPLLGTRLMAKTPGRKAVPRQK